MPFLGGRKYSDIFDLKVKRKGCFQGAAAHNSPEHRVLFLGVRGNIMMIFYYAIGDIFLI